MASARAFRTLLVGPGNAGRRFHQALRYGRCAERFDVVALVDGDTKRLAAVDGNHNAYAHLDLALRREAPEVVVVCVNEEAHFAVLDAVLATRSVRHVVCEKPLTRTIDEFRLLAPERRGVPVSVNFCKRYSPVIDDCMDWLARQSASIGRVKFYWGKYRVRDPRPTMGVLSELSHPLALVRYLLNSPAETPLHLASATATHSDFSSFSDHVCDGVNLVGSLSKCLVVGTSSFMCEERRRRLILYARNPAHSHTWQLVLDFDNPVWDNDTFSAYMLEPAGGRRVEVAHTAYRATEIPEDHARRDRSAGAGHHRRRVRPPVRRAGTPRHDRRYSRMIQKTHIIGQDDLAAVVETCGWDTLMDLMINRLQEAFVDAARGNGTTPARDGFRRCQDASGVLEWMPHHEPGRSVTIKTVAYTPTNPGALGLPTILGTVARFDDITGHLVAVSDGVLLTALRTGAASAVASRLLASTDSHVVGLVGAGAQAVTQLHALSRIFDLERVLVHDTNAGHAASFPDRVAFLGVDVHIVGVPEIEASADIISTATSVPVGAGPVLPGTALQPHVHVNAVGADLPGKTELPVGLLRSALVCPDHVQQARREGECQQLGDDDLGPDLPTLCAHPQMAHPHRRRLTVFDSTGFALEDHVALDVVLELAVELGVGRRIQLEFIPDDALNPYAPRRTPRAADRSERDERTGPSRATIVKAPTPS
ncbi:MAG: Gfo/Idh/MocA family oxidoreductase [Pseudonocardiaceae bacterium]